jgi:FdhD protein
MDEMIVKRKIRRFFADGSSKELFDEIINEHRLKIRINGADFLEVVVSPSLLKEFVCGFLLTRGLIGRYEDIFSIAIESGIASIECASAQDKVLPRAGIIETTGSRNINLAGEVGIKGAIKNRDFKVSAQTIIQKMQTLSLMPVFQRTGGSHSAVLFNADGDAVFSAEDLGRHNSVDKVTGGGLIKGVDLSRCWLAVSGRLPSDMVLKAVSAGIPVIGSVSAVTSDGMDIGEASGITVIGFTREGRFNCYCHPERIG